MTVELLQDPISERHESTVERIFRKLSIIIALFAFSLTILVLAVLYFSAIYRGIQDGVWLPIIKDPFVAAFGFPLSVIVSFAIVQILRGFHGPIEFQAFGMKFMGATGPVLLWLLCFLGIAWGISFLWTLPAK